MTPWRWTQHVSPKRWYLLTNLLGIIAHKYIDNELCYGFSPHDGASISAVCWWTGVTGMRVLPFLFHFFFRGCEVLKPNVCWLRSNDSNREHFMIFQVLTAASMNMTAFCNIAPCSLVEVDRRFRGYYCLHHQGDDWGSTQVWNAGLLQQDYMALSSQKDVIFTLTTMRTRNHTNFFFLCPLACSAS